MITGFACFGIIIEPKKIERKKGKDAERNG